MAQKDLTQQDKANLHAALKANGGVTASEGYYHVLSGQRRNGRLVPKDVANFLKKEGVPLEYKGKPWKRGKSQVYGAKPIQETGTSFIAESAKKYD